MSLTGRIRNSIHRMTDPVKRLLRRRSGAPLEIITAAQALELCQKFLIGAWSKIDVENLKMERISGGLSNYIYYCSLPDEIQLENNEPRKVLLRIYGESHKKHRGTLLIDSVICTLLSERKLGPKIHGIFPEGRLEEFVEAESLTVSEIRNPNISKQIGRLLGEIHLLDMPLIKEPIWFFQTIEQFLSDLPNDLSKFEIEEDRTIYDQMRNICQFREEFEELKKILLNTKSLVCFTHNDFQPGNILRLKSENESFTVIDFEYCSYNYRGFDIGNHFCEFMFDYKSQREWPFFKFDLTNYPNRFEQINFLSGYIEAEEAKLPEPIADRDSLVETLIKEANFFALASHFFWTLWAINMATSTRIKFGYMEYARARLTAYYLKRHLLMNVGSIPPVISEDLVNSTTNPFRRS